MTTKFTPGPWVSRASPFEVYNMDHGPLSGEIVSGHNLIAAMYDGYNTPDADLIAAAPDLYEALYALLGALTMECYDDALKKCNDALAKARGES
jgi:hypothetical protein